MSNAKILNTDNPDFKFYYRPDANIFARDDSQLQTYFDGDTSIFAFDKYGFSLEYHLTLTRNVGNTSTDGFLLFGKDIISKNTNFYSKYQVSFLPEGCSSIIDTSVLKNISNDQLTPIGTLDGIQLYTLTDKNNPLYKLEYTRKIERIKEYNQANNDPTPLPNYDDYLTKNPILLMKDLWGRLISTGESEFDIPKGCGKPVIYLYPTKPTQIHIDFATKIILDTNIPTYHNGWSVLANPNSQLTDLQPQYTICNKIPLIFGTEYAQSACKSNKYPYIYWSGQSIEKRMPQTQTGWIINNNDVNSFLNSTLTYIGLNDNEKKDMISYWLPEMQKSNAPYYRINFLQTAQMNEFIPMQITPKPDSIFRIFLDWNPIYSKPTNTLSAPGLHKINRSGFTIVEWGGVKN